MNTTAAAAADRPLPGLLRFARLVRSLIRKVQIRRRHVPLPVKVLLGMASLPVVAVLIPCIQLLSRRELNEDQSPAFFGSSFLLQLHDSIQLCLYFFSIWEPDITEFVKSRLRPGGVFIDVGANVGYYTLLASTLVGERGCVMAVEASPKIFSLLKRNLALNPAATNVRAVNMAASDRIETLTVFLAPDTSLAWTTTVETPKYRREASVSAGPLATILDEAQIKGATLIKIDVEGAEDKVLGGLASLLPALPEEVEILVELTPKRWQSHRKSIEELLAPFFEAGFNAYRVENSYAPWRFLWPNDTKRPRRLRGKIRTRRLLQQVDIILSRRDLPRL